VPIEDLVLDLANPRLGGVASQNDAMRGLVNLGVKYFRDLMTSIKAHGLDPGDSFYVLRDEEDEENYIVVDGNRRLAALKVLVEPLLLNALDLPDSKLKSIAKIAAGVDPDSLNDIECVLFDDRATADAWIERRHGRELGGEGRLTWSPLEIERFQKDRSTLDVIDFVERGVGSVREDWAATRSAVEKNSSTLRRFLDSKPGRGWLGYSTRDDDETGWKGPAFSRDSKMVLSVLDRIFSDIAAGDVTSRTHNTADDIDRYFQALPKKLQPTGAVSKKPTLFRDAHKPEVEVNTPTSSTRAPSAGTRPKKPRLSLAPKKHEFRQPETTKGQRLIAEGSKLKVAEFPLAAAYLLRAFLEHTIDSYMEWNRISRVEGKRLLELKVRAERVIDHLHANGTSANSLRGAKRALTNTSDPSSIQALNDYHHDRYQIPAADTLRNCWDACVPLFVAVWGRAQ
jgi:hypothetical protein